MNYKNHWATIGVVIALALLFIATTQYPGGSLHDANSVGFQWQHNYLSNLVNPKAVNGADNTARPWAVAGVLVLCAAMGLCFFRISRKLPSKGGVAAVTRYAGTGAMAASVLLATPLHDIGVTISGTLLLLALFYVTVLLFRTKFHWLKALAIVAMLLLYVSAFVYGTRSYLEFLPILQKINLITTISLLLAVDYLTKADDFEPSKPAGAS